MGPFIIRVWVEKIQLEPEMEFVISRTVGVENVTTGSPLSGEIGDSPILWVTIANKIVWRFWLFWQLGSSLPRVRGVPRGDIWRSPEANRRAHGPPALDKGHWLGPSESQQWEQKTGRNEWNLYTNGVIIIKGWLVPEPSSMACDFCAANISPGTGPGAPSQWCKKMGFCPSTISQATHLSVLSTSPEAELRTKLIKVRTFRKRLASRRGGERREWDIEMIIL